MNRNIMFVISAVLVVIFVAGAVQFLSTRPVVSPTIQTATSTSEQITSASTTSAVLTANVNTTPKNPATNPLQLANVDKIISWDFQGAYTDNPELVAKAENEIKRLSFLLDTATSSAMILSVGIANQYELLGDGKKQYEYLERAIKADVNVTSGLPWHNLGVLMERLGALQTARIAYEKSTIVQPQLKQWRYSYIEFLTTKMKDDIATIEKAFTAADKYFATDTDIIQLRTEWEKS